jgi:hypothetical protein
MSKRELSQIEEKGAQWAVKCALDLLNVGELRFFANEYEPFYARRTRGDRKVRVVEFDPFEQHKMCSLLFAPAFGSCDARMLSLGNGKRTPDELFAAFERGAIETIRTLFCDEDRAHDGI